MSLLTFTRFYTYDIELLKNPQYYLAITAIFRDEARFLKEWIEFYKLMGVEHFYLYNHLSKDDYLSVLEPYRSEGLVDLYNVNDEVGHAGIMNVLQSNIYKHAIERTRNNVEWLIIVDIDEFLFPIKANNLPSVLKKYDDTASLSVNWRNFGSGNVTKIAENETLIEKMLMRGEYQPRDNLHVKSIVKPRYVENIINPHFPVLKAGYAQVTENGQVFYGPFTHFPSNNILTINHYWARDWEFFNSTKLTRIHLLKIDSKEPDKNAIIEKLVQKNIQLSTIFDDSILRFVPDLRMQMFGKESEEELCPDLMGCINETTI